MKKLVAVVLTILTCGAAYALPLGNPSEASLMCDGLVYDGLCADFCQPGIGWCDAWSFRVGFYGDYVFQKHLEINSGIHNEDDIEHFEMFTNAGYFVVNFWDRLDIFFTLGATNMRFETNAGSFASGPSNVSGDRLVLETETDFSWSIGLRSTLWQCGCFSLGAEAQYFRARPDVSYIDVGYTVGTYPDGMIDAKYQEWQIGAGLAYRVWNFIPYIGAKFGHLDINFDDATIDLIPDPELETLIFGHDANSKHRWGYALGVSIVDCEKSSLTVEARYPDETALYVNGQIRF